DIPRHPGAFDAPVRPAADSGIVAVAGAFRWHDSPREHARRDPVHHAAGAQHSFRDAGPVDPLPRRRTVGGLAAIPRPGDNRQYAVFAVAGALSQDHRNHGLMLFRGESMNKSLPLLTLAAVFSAPVFAENTGEVPDRGSTLSFVYENDS